MLTPLDPYLYQALRFHLARGEASMKVLTAVALLGTGLFAHPAVACDSKVTTSGSVTAKCSCENAAECTCKKNSCQCKKCGLHRKPARIIEALKGAPQPLEVPAEARYDATAGVFI
jgi:hypothetical protein